MLFILRCVYGMLPYMMFAIPVVIVWRLVAVKILFKKQGLCTTAHHEVGTLIFSLFLVGLASQTILPGLAFFDGKLHVAAMSFSTEPYYNLVPFTVLYDTYRLVSVGVYSSLSINLIGNIVMFVPIGFFIPLLRDGISIRKVTLIGFCTSVAIELLQIPLRGRCSDIDDLWLNTLGTWLGFLLANQMQRCLPALVSKFKVRCYE